MEDFLTIEKPIQSTTTTLFAHENTPVRHQSSLAVGTVETVTVGTAPRILLYDAVIKGLARRI